MILSDRIRDGETVSITFDGPHNRLVVVPNHEGIDYNDMDDDDSDDIDIVEMD